MLRTIRGLLASLFLFAAAPAQDAKPDRWLIQFQTRSFNLLEFRKANLRRDADAVARIVAELEAQVRKDQAPFVRAVRDLGGRVTRQFWIVNACGLEIDVSKIDRVRELPGVRRVERDIIMMPLNHKSTNLVNHNSDFVNVKGFKGANVGVAILDTGQDAQMGNKQRPHRMYYPDGDLTKTSRLKLNRQIGQRLPEDVQGHGTAVAGVAVGGNWGTVQADNGHAPHADILGYSIEDLIFGGAYATTVTAAWQQVATDAVRYRIVAANNSYSGSPDPLQTTQQALDSCALNANVLICTPSGNWNASTMTSQSCANGLAVGAVAGDTHTMAPFSSRGPLLGDPMRFFPDIVACGVNIVMPKVNDEGANFTSSGTSAASPQVCGAAALLRSAVPSLTAIETKAILLTSAVDISAKNGTPPYNSRNAYGMGFLRDDYALAVAQQTTARGTASVSKATPTWIKGIACKKGQSYRAAITWMRGIMTSKAWSNLDIEVRLGTTVVASSKTTRNLYELVQWTAAQTGSYVLRITAPRIEQNTQSFAWAAMEVARPPAAGGFTRFGAGCRGTGAGGDVLPTNYRRQMGNIANSLPFCYPNIRYQQVFLSSEIIGSSSVFVGLSLRQDDRIPSRSSGPQHIVIKLGYSTFGPTTLTTNFANNVIKGTAVTVFNGTLNVPPMVGTNSDPSKFVSTVKFTTPFRFMKQAGRNLIMEVINSSPASVSVGFDAARGTAVQAARLFGLSTTATTGTVAHNYGLIVRFNTQGKGGGPTPVFDVRDMPQINSVLKFELRQANKSSLALLLVGASKKRWGAIPLPFDLTPAGAAGCSLLTSNDLIGVTRTNAMGTASLPLPLPNDRTLIGALFYGQFAVYDGVTNPLGWVFSNGGEILFGGQR